MRCAISSSVKAPLALRFKRSGRLARTTRLRIFSPTRWFEIQSRESVLAFVSQNTKNGNKRGQKINKRGQNVSAL